MDQTYDNQKIKLFELIKVIQKDQIVYFCLDDFYFILQMRTYYDKNFKYYNFIIYISNFFILEKPYLNILEYRNKEKLNNMKK